MIDKLMPRHSLKHLNSFKLSVTARELKQVTSIAVLEALLPVNNNVLVLGGGSNMLFIEDYDGTVLHNQLSGIELSQDHDFHYVRVAGGENWHDLVMQCAQAGIGGLENLALIPGTVGAAPVQNIGAYGVEFCNVCQYVEAYDLDSGEKHIFDVAQCKFSYRDSLFKSHRRYFITSVTLKLSKQWQPQLAYGELTTWAGGLLSPPTPLQVATEVIAIRANKLPDPKVIPNVGSFFKNPLVSKTQAQTLKSRFPDMPQYPTNDQVKLAAGWLIDHLGLKGHSIGGAGVHLKQALVLINKQDAASHDVVLLAQTICQQVNAHFDVMLVPEVNVITANGYSELPQEISDV